MMQMPLLRARCLKEMLPSYGIALVAGLVLLAALIPAVEMLYYHSLESASGGPEMKFLGTRLNVLSAPPWIGVAVLAVAGFALLAVARRKVKAQWDKVMGEIASGRLS
jgi:type II secretory pathway component PulF